MRKRTWTMAALALVVLFGVNRGTAKAEWQSIKEVQENTPERWTESYETKWRTIQIDAQIDEIAEFTDLGEYLDMPMRTYSSGMTVRLGFAVSTSVHADIVIMDEWLSVGDADFQLKATQRLNDMVNRASILILASHSMDLVEKTCNKIIRMEHGKIAEIYENTFIAV